MSKARTERLRRLKLACETVEDELNRLPPRDPRQPKMDWQARDSFHEVIRHLKARWAQLNGGDDAE